MDTLISGAVTSFFHASNRFIDIHKTIAWATNGATFCCIKTRIDRWKHQLLYRLSAKIATVSLVSSFPRIVLGPQCFARWSAAPSSLGSSPKKDLEISPLMASSFYTSFLTDAGQVSVAAFLVGLRWRLALICDSRHYLVLISNLFTCDLFIFAGMVQVALILFWRPLQLEQPEFFITIWIYHQQVIFSCYRNKILQFFSPTIFCPPHVPGHLQRIFTRTPTCQNRTLLSRSMRSTKMVCPCDKIASKATETFGRFDRRSWFQVTRNYCQYVRTCTEMEKGVRNEWRRLEWLSYGRGAGLRRFKDYRWSCSILYGKAYGVPRKWKCSRTRGLWWVEKLVDAKCRNLADSKVDKTNHNPCNLNTNGFQRNDSLSAQARLRFVCSTAEGLCTIQTSPSDTMHALMV